MAKKKKADKKGKPKGGAQKPTTTGKKGGGVGGGFTSRASNLLPGVKGRDYSIVSHGGRLYAVYDVRLPQGGVLKLAWRISPGDYAAYGLSPKDARKVSGSEFEALNVFGNAREIVRRGDDAHPLQKFLKQLRQRYPNASWLQDAQFMSTYLMGYMEGWSQEELLVRLQRTKWYQSRTDYQRAWETDFTRAEKSQAIAFWTTQVREALDELYGVEIPYTSRFTAGQIKDIATKIASGVWGEPNDGFQIWFSQAQNEAEGLEGTAAWIDAEQEGERLRGLRNRPEDMYEQIREDAIRWLGPMGIPDEASLKQWAKDLVSEVRSEGDWFAFLRQRAKALYPWLGTDEPWMDRASVYKRIAEEQWGLPIAWEHPVLGNIGSAQQIDEFTKLVRQAPEFWSGPVGREETHDLFNYLNETFLGVR